jgi:hypothetical protein
MTNATRFTEMMAAYLEWKGQRQELKGALRKSFEVWVAEAKPDLFETYTGREMEFSLQCKEAQNACSSSRVGKGIGPATLQKHSPELIRIYRNLPETERTSFLEFLVKVQEACETEGALLSYIAVHR